MGDDPITTPAVTNYLLSCTLERNSEDVCSGSGMITGTAYQIPVNNFQQLGNYMFSLRANNRVGLSDDSEISFIGELVQSLLVYHMTLTLRRLVRRLKIVCEYVRVCLLF